MKKNQKAFISAYIKKNASLLVSTGAALCLFASRSKLVLLAEAAIFFTVAYAAWLNGNIPQRLQEQEQNPATLLLAADFALIGALYFVNNMKNLLPTLPLTVPIAIALVCAAVSFPAFRCLACWMDRQIFDLLGTDTTRCGLRCRLWDMLFPVSYAAFFLLDNRLNMGVLYLYSLMAGAGIAVVIANRVSPLWRFCWKDSPLWVLFCSLSAIGICLFQQKGWRAIAPETGPGGTVLAIVAYFFVFVCISGFWRWFRQAIRGLFQDVTWGEWVFYGGLLLVLLGIVTAVFLRTDAFYGTNYPYDIVYTSDSHILVQNNAYLWISNDQNDLRQPLFAVFSAPFLGLSYLISTLFSAPAPVNALLMNYPQILLLFLANFLLAKILGLSGWKRAGVMLLLTFAYPTLLFSFMMEQYILAYFFLIFFLYSVLANQPDAVSFCGAGGTLLTSVITLPLMSGKNPRLDWNGWFQDVLNSLIRFVIFLLAFSRLDIILNAAGSLAELKRFAGEALSLFAKLCQYTAFVSGCLWAPAAQVAENAWGNISWQLAQAQTLNIAGIGILLLCVLSVALNRRDPLSCFAGFWVAFSALVLLVAGWGTQENGLILYSLYFGWAFPVLLYRLTERVGAMLSIPYLAGISSIIGSAILLAINAPAMAELIAFAMDAYPL